MSTSWINLPKKKIHLNMNQYIKKWDCFQFVRSILPSNCVILHIHKQRSRYSYNTAKLNRKTSVLMHHFFSLHIAYTLYWTYNQLLLYFIEKNNNAIIIVIVLALCFYCFVRCFGLKHLLNQGVSNCGSQPTCGLQSGIRWVAQSHLTTAKFVFQWHTHFSLGLHDVAYNIIYQS